MAAPTTPAKSAADWEIVYTAQNADFDQVGAIAIHVMKADGSDDREIVPDALWPSVAADGSMAYLSGEHDESVIRVADRDGKNSRSIFSTTEDKQLVFAPTLSRDGTHVAFVVIDGAVSLRAAHIMVGNADGTGLERVIDVQAVPHLGMTFSPDGKTLLFPDIRGDGESTESSELYTAGIDGSDPKLFGGAPGAGSASYSPDGSQIVYVADAGDANAIHVINSDGTGDHKIADASTAQFINPVSAVWTPDGEHIIFSDKSESNGKGLLSLYSVNLDGSDRKLLKESALAPAVRPAVG